MKLDIVLDRDLLERGIRHYRQLNLNTASWLVFGESGSGKSVLTKSIIGRIGTHIPRALVTVCDGKADDYRFLCDIPGARHYEALECERGLSEFYSMFDQKRKGIDANRDTLHFLAFEEWSTFLTKIEVTDKKAYKECFAQMFALTSQGRSYNCHVLASFQRMDSTFTSGFRENFTTVIGLGERISPEAARMAGFNDFEEFSNTGGGKSQGYMRSDDGFFRVQVPNITRWDVLHQAIIEAVTRQ